MLNTTIRELLSKMTRDISSNIKKLQRVFGSLDYTDNEKQSILHILVDNKYDEEKCFLAIQSLLKSGLSPNLQDCYKYNFIQTALYAGYSENFILNIIHESLKYNLDVNHTDDDKDTIVHTAIYSDNYLGEIERIYELLCANQFDSSLVDHDGRNLIEAMIYQHQYSDLQIERFRKLFNANFHKRTASQVKVDLVKYEKVVPTTPIISEKEIDELEKCGKVLNRKDFPVEPTIGREKEIKNLIVSLAQRKKTPLLVGESGVGKTALADELVYLIKTRQVPNFLQDKIVLEIDPSEIVEGSEYVGVFEKNMHRVLNLCEKYGVIIFIDEIHTIYGIGSTKNKNNDMAAMLKRFIDRSNTKVIGTTTDLEYEEYFTRDALKRRFEKVMVYEPKDNLLYRIIDKVIDDFVTIEGIPFENSTIKGQILPILLEVTKKEHRVYNDIMNNPDLAISIVDKAFAFAKVYNSEFITVEHFIESLECCDRIYETAKNKAISSLKNLGSTISVPVSKVLKFDPNQS